MLALAEGEGGGPGGARGVRYYQRGDESGGLDRARCLKLVGEDLVIKSIQKASYRYQYLIYVFYNGYIRANNKIVARIMPFSASNA